MRRPVRNLALLLGALALVWLPIEDVSEAWALLLALGVALLLIAHFAPRIRSAPRPTLSYPLAGLLAGLTVTPTTLFLMIFKTGMHGHGRPDFTPEQFASVVARTPVWVAAGLLVGLGWALVQKSR